MIDYSDGVFRLTTANTGYYFRVTRFSHLEHIFYGEKLEDTNLEPLMVKHTVQIGSQTNYDESDPLYTLDTLSLEWSGIGKGDYRNPPCEICMPDQSYVSDFQYVAHRQVPGNITPVSLPSSYGGESACQTLEITLQDKSSNVTLLLYYTVYEETDVITRRTVLSNENERPLQIRKIMSMMIDLPDRGYSLTTFHGGWIKEAHKQDMPLGYGQFVNESLTGNSSNRHNPGFLLSEKGANETSGRVYGFNLVYSGNHYSGIELTERGLVRIMTAINPHCFTWPLQKGESFETPEAIMTFSAEGYNGTSDHFHRFIREHITRGEYRDKERPVLFNSWEARFFRFNERSLLQLARQAKSLGVELFVLDDGWFGERNDDTKGLGDYSVNRKKFPGGLERLSEGLEKIGLSFGLWFEPEMVNPDSDLYRAHPEYAVRIPGREPSYGRHQLVLDLCNPKVRDYIVASVGAILSSCRISYVKWDMNRNMSDMFSPAIREQGTFFHRYILGLYEVLTRIFAKRPDILLETCSSGGNRFDLGMLCFSPQIWASDNTDPIERLSIQGGLSYLYPLSSIAAHVSSAPHQQTLRNTSLASRFHTAAFGALGYELDLKYLSSPEKAEIREQIAFYKAHRRTLQFGRFYRFDPVKDNKVHWSVVASDKSEAVAGFFQTQAHASEGLDVLPVCGLAPYRKYRIRTRTQPIYVRKYGALINFLLPFPVHPRGILARLIDRFYRLRDCTEEYEGTGKLFSAGIRLNDTFSGTYWNDRTRLLSDFDSNLYAINQVGPG